MAFGNCAKRCANAGRRRLGRLQLAHSGRITRLKRRLLQEIKRTQLERAEICLPAVRKRLRLSLHERDRCCVEIGAPNVGIPGEDADVLSERLLLDHGVELFGDAVADNVERQRLAGDPLIDGHDMEAVARFYKLRQEPGRGRRAPVTAPNSRRPHIDRRRGLWR